ncbi:MAG: hypothetical protein KGM47_11365 [Acidobacteriota bacterium]|nr:hypothetical protein [Acidobacteriota bacterium]
MPDIAIADELEKIRSDIDLKFVSYGTGAKTFAAGGGDIVLHVAGPKGSV